MRRLDDTEAAEPAQEAAETAPEAASGSCLYMENCFTSFIITSSGERIQIPDLRSAMEWAAENPEAVFGDLDVAVWRFTHKDLCGNFEKRCIVVDWCGQNQWFFQLDDSFFERCWAGMLAMGHSLHPMEPERRTVPAIENAVDFVDVTDYYFPAVSPATSGDVIAAANRATNMFERAYTDHQDVKMWTARMPQNGNAEAVAEVQATVEKFRRMRDAEISQAIRLIDPVIVDPDQVRQTFRDTDDVAQACMAIRDILNGYTCAAWNADTEAIRQMRENGNAGMREHIRAMSAGVSGDLAENP